ncbi:MAG: BlaI/MecI/CopY family transcriptional regulator [Fimbriimonas sp.]|nr:BlaI/MecI/CopY family transcriptional regulator [Fimbriimonas sp.]
MTDPQDMPGLSEAQLEIMNIIWEQSETTLGEIWRELQAKRTMAKNTVQTLLTRLVEKGWVSYRAEGKIFHYRAAVPKQPTMKHVVGRFVDTAFNGSAEGLVMALLDSQELDGDEVERIRALIDKAQRDRR